MEFLGSILSGGSGAAGKAAGDLTLTDHFGLMAGNAQDKVPYGSRQAYGMQAGMNAPQYNAQEPMSGIQGLLGMSGGVGGTSHLPAMNRPGVAQPLQQPQLGQQSIGALGLPWQSLFNTPQTEWTPKQIQQVIPHLLALGTRMNKGK